MRSGRMVLLVTLALLVAPLAADAQQPTKILMQSCS
jgi:hypothetical protein